MWALHVVSTCKWIEVIRGNFLTSVYFLPMNSLKRSNSSDRSSDKDRSRSSKIFLKVSTPLIFIDSTMQNPKRGLQAWWSIPIIWLKTFFIIFLCQKLFRAIISRFFLQVQLLLSFRCPVLPTFGALSAVANFFSFIPEK